MIYNHPPADTPIQQGDIFVDIPRPEISLSRVLVVPERPGSAIVETTWSGALQSARIPTLLVPAAAVPAIVITQNCDALRARDISLCEIRPFSDVETSIDSRTATNESWMAAVTQQSKKNLKWFYLPPDANVGFNQRMAVDFQSTICIPRADLEGHRGRRVGRLGPEADAHFRDRLAHFFRRYPVDEWYPLNRDEFVEYRKRHPDAAPREWQK